MKRLNVQRLIEDLGVRHVAEITGKGRTAPYGWIKRGYVGNHILDAIKSHHPKLNIDSYFEEEAHNDKPNAE